MYKKVYNNYICKKNEIIEQTKKIIEADKVIKTRFVQDDNTEKYDKKILNRFKRQRAQIEERIYNASNKYRKIL